MAALLDGMSAVWSAALLDGMNSGNIDGIAW